MKKIKNGINGRTKLSEKRIADALNQAARDAVETHRHAGQPLVVWKDGKTVLISADEVELPKPARKKPRTRIT